jgi:hypothetical protein
MEEKLKFIQIAKKKGLLKKDNSKLIHLSGLENDQNISPKLNLLTVELLKAVYKISGGNKK